MSLKPNSLIIVTALSSVMAVAGGILFFSQGDSQLTTAKQLPVLATPITALQQESYPLAPEDIAALINQSNGEASENTVQQQPVPLLLPSSLLGSTLPLALDVNDSGELVINKKIQHLFDFYLSAMGEENLDIIVTRIKHNLTSQLVEPALTQSVDILSGYLQYMNAVTAIKQQFEQSTDLDSVGEYALDNVIEVREMVLDARSNYLDSDVIEAFFGQADEYESYMLSLAAINKNKALTDTEKKTAKAALDTAAPAWLLAQQDRANQLNQYRAQYQNLQAQGASQAELQGFMAESFSPEVSDRLVALDEKRQQWQIKLDQYREELAVITAGSSTDQYHDDEVEQQQLEITQLREAYFSPQEIKRVSALDAINSRGSRTANSTTAL